MDDCHLALVLIINIHFLCFLIALDFLSHVCCASISVDYYCFVILQHCVASGKIRSCYGKVCITHVLLLTVYNVAVYFT